MQQIRFTLSHFQLNGIEFTHLCLFSGLDPVIEVKKHQITYKTDGHKAFQQWKGSSLRELLLSEPYLVLSIAFLLFRASLYFFPGLVAHVVALWVAYIPHLNMGIFGESRQLLGRVFHVIDLKRAWSKLKLSKTRNFHKGARNARVWLRLWHLFRWERRQQQECPPQETRKPLLVVSCIGLSLKPRS